MESGNGRKNNLEPEIKCHPDVIKLLAHMKRILNVICKPPYIIQSHCEPASTALIQYPKLAAQKYFDVAEPQN